jgi:hypothetical protein
MCSSGRGYYRRSVIEPGHKGIEEADLKWLVMVVVAMVVAVVVEVV